MKQEFDPSKLLASPDGIRIKLQIIFILPLILGVIFHEINHPNCKYGIFSSNLSVQLSDNIEVISEITVPPTKFSQFENGEFYFNWKGKRTKVPITQEIEDYFKIQPIDQASNNSK